MGTFMNSRMLMTPQEIFEFTGRVIADAPYGPLVVEYQVAEDFTQRGRDEEAVVEMSLCYHCRDNSSGGGPASGAFPDMPREVYVLHFRKAFREKNEKWRSKRDKEAAIWHLERLGVRVIFNDQESPND